MRYAMPSPVLIGSHYYLRVRVPTDVVDSAKGTFFSVTVGKATVTSKVGDAVKVPLKTKDLALAKQRFIHVLAAVDAYWEALRRGSADSYGKSDAMLPALAHEMQKIRSYM